MTDVPKQVQAILAELISAGFEAVLVGGCVRDMVRGAPPKDWDIATSATPQEVQQVFPRTVYENTFGTVGVIIRGTLYEVTTYRSDGPYADARHPTTVTFVRTLEDDLARRDFTINAMAWRDGALVDPHGGLVDLEQRLIRTVGDPRKRFSEDALRLMRAVRFCSQLGFSLETATRFALEGAAESLRAVSSERIRDELMKILASADPAGGVRLLYETHLLHEVIPELLEGEQMSQPKHHKYNVLEHSIRSLQTTPSNDPLVRLAALLHDVGKPRSAHGPEAERTFHGHEVIGSRMTRQIMKRLAFSKADTERVVNLVRHHMFLFQFESTDKAIRRIIRRVGADNIQDLVDLRVGDRLGSGCKIGYTKKLQNFQERVVEVQKDPIDTRMLAINGSDVMKILGIPPGPRIGAIMQQLLEDVLDDPARNTAEHLSARVRELGKETA